MDQPSKPISGTIAHHIAQGLHRVEIWCNSCTRYVAVTIDDLPPDIPINQVWRRYRCETCGGKNLSSRMDVSEFYDKIDKDKKERSRRW